MATAQRYVKTLSKTLALKPNETQIILTALNEHIKCSHFSIESMAKNFNKSMKTIQFENQEIRLEKAQRKRENPNALIHKKRIIELYQDNEDGPGFGYKKIYEILLEACKNEEERQKTISPSSIRTYLHEKWGVAKNTDRRIPIEAIENRKLQGIVLF